MSCEYRYAVLYDFCEGGTAKGAGLGAQKVSLCIRLCWVSIAAQAQTCILTKNLLFAVCFWVADYLVDPGDRSRPCRRICSPPGTGTAFEFLSVSYFNIHVLVRDPHIREQRGTQS